MLPFLVALVLTKENPFGNIAVGLPSIRRVGLLDVNNEKLNLVSELVADLFDSPKLGAERRSSIAAENQCYRPFSPEARKPDPLVRTF